VKERPSSLHGGRAALFLAMAAAGIEPAAWNFWRERSDSVERRSQRTSRHGTSRGVAREELVREHGWEYRSSRPEGMVLHVADWWQRVVMS
jgi:hypothetical protein